MRQALDLGHALAAAVVLLTALVALAARPRRAAGIRLVALVGIAAALAWEWAEFRVPYDFKRFWWVGHDLAAGLDYYALDPRGDRDLILNPPTALPLFRAFAWFPLRTSARLWAALNALGVLGLVPLAYATLRARIGPSAPRLPRHHLGILAVALASSCAQGMGLALGQVSVLATAAILAALHAQGVGRPRLAGFWLAVAAIKANTVIPFLALFLRRRDRWTWASLVLSCLAFGLATGRPADWPRRVAKTLETIRATQEPGRVNDYGFEGPSHASLIGIDHALYRVGLRRREAIEAARVAVLVMLGLGLLGGLRSGALPRGGACALVGLYASVFLYHRTYDMVLLALPLTYAALVAGALFGASGRRMTCWSALILLVPFVNPEGLLTLERLSFGLGPAGRVLQALALPIATWLILAALAGLWWSMPDCRRAEGADREVSGSVV